MEVGVDDGEFYCGRKDKFGLNLQAVCDARCRFTYISLQHPSPASNYLAFVTSSLYGQLTEGEGLPQGYCLYGDNAYVNESYMAIPFQARQMDQKIPIRYSHDLLTLMDFMDFDESNDSESPCPIGLLSGGEHFADVSGGRREQRRLSHRRHQPNNAHWE